MRYQPYPSYKPSGVDWLGDVPEHWRVERLKRQFRIFNGGTPSSSEDAYWDGEITWLTPDDLGRNENKRIAGSRRQISKEGLDNCGARLVSKGSIVVSTRAPIGHIAITELETCTNQGCRSLVPLRENVWTDFYYYTLIASKEVLQAIGKGTTFMELSAGALGSHGTPVPSLPEQRVIAGFLDRETAKIDTLVAKKRALTETLQEKRSALISRTVTRGLPPEAARAAGLDPHPKLKPSGIERLGDVPAHWEVKPLGYLVRFRGGATPDKGKPEYWDGDIPWVSPKDMKRPRIADAEDHVSIDGLRNSAASTVPPDAVLIVVRGMILAHSFPVALTEAPLTINQDMKALLCGYRVGAEFLFWELCGSSRALVSLADESAHGTRKLETATLAKFRILVPPIPEQGAIAAFLDRETAKIDRMAANVEEAIKRLQEYRAALITAAVTGKIDVRGVAA